MGSRFMLLRELEEEDASMKNVVTSMVARFLGIFVMLDIVDHLAVVQEDVKCSRRNYLKVSQGHG